MEQNEGGGNDGGVGGHALGGGGGGSKCSITVVNESKRAVLLTIFRYISNIYIGAAVKLVVKLVSKAVTHYI